MVSAYAGLAQLMLPNEEDPSSFPVNRSGWHAWQCDFDRADGCAMHIAP